MSLPYYKKYAKDFLDGTAGMSGELKGAYSVLLDLIYIQSGKLPDDPHYISGNLGYSVRKWNSIKAELIKRGKIEVNHGIISNKRADKEQIILSKYQVNQAEKASKSNKNNKLANAVAGTDYINAESEPDIKKTIIKKDLEERFKKLLAAYPVYPTKYNQALEVFEEALASDIPQDLIIFSALRVRNQHEVKTPENKKFTLGLNKWLEQRNYENDRKAWEYSQKPQEAKPQQQKPKAKLSPNHFSVQWEAKKKEAQ